MTDTITRARELMAKVQSTAYGDGVTLEQAIFAFNVCGPLLDVLEAFSQKVRVDAIDDDWSCRWCGGADRHSPRCAVGIALAAIEKALEETK